LRRGRRLTYADSRMKNLCVSNWEFSRRIQDSATLLGTRRLTYADPHMRNLLLALLHLAVVTAKLLAPGVSER
jgi:hypothetical protein